MKLLFACFLLLTSVSTALAHEGELTKILREECQQFSKLLPFSQAMQRYDYNVENERLCHDEGFNCWGDKITVTFNYKITFKTIYDFYTSSGKLVTSKTEKKVSVLDTEMSEHRVGEWDYEFDRGLTQYIPQDNLAKEQVKKLYENLLKRMEETQRRIRWEESVKFCEE